jgi:hypothetical protein
LKRDEVPFSVENKKGCLRGAQSKKQGVKRDFAPLHKSISPFPFLRGRGIKGDGVI